MAAVEKLGWEAFVTVLARAANVSSEAIERRTRLADDLGLDSLAFAEVIVALLVDLDMESIEQDLGQRDWRDVTVGELFDEYQSGQGRARGEQFVMRTRWPR